MSQYTKKDPSEVRKGLSIVTSLSSLRN